MRSFSGLLKKLAHRQKPRRPEDKPTGEGMGGGGGGAKPKGDGFTPKPQ